eukprot:augustus_masked-scaffold_13-processed-gene-9.2-mRNA-1 protein AED:1.00 eAED:1.00 QI:0/-1/0/0/-1/1/1/0/896
MSQFEVVAEGAFISEADYDSFLGLTLCLLSSRVVGKTHLNELNKPGSRYPFLLKPALKEQLEYYTSIEYAVNDEVTRKLVKSVHLLRIGVLRIITYHTLTESDVPTFENVPREAEELIGFSEELKQMVSPEYELYKIFHRALVDAWEAFREMYNKLKTLEFLAGFDYGDVEKSGRLFRNLLIAIKIAVACSFFRELEQAFNLEREYEGGVEAQKSPVECLNFLIDTTFVLESLRQLRKKGKLVAAQERKILRTKVSRPNFDRYRAITEILPPVSYVLRHTLMVHRIVDHYVKVDANTSSKELFGGGFRSFYSQLQKNLSVFQRTVVAKVEKKKLGKKVEINPKDPNVLIIAITDDGDTSLPNRVVLNQYPKHVYVVNSESLATVDDFIPGSVAGQNARVVVGSNDRFVFFGHANGKIEVYRIQKRLHSQGFASQRPNAPLQNRKRKSLNCKSTVRALCVDSRNVGFRSANGMTQQTRLFAGLLNGSIAIYGCSEDESNFTLKCNLNYAATEDGSSPVTCLELDEIIDVQTRSPATRLFSGHDSGMIQLWDISDLTNCNILATFTSKGSIIGLSVSPGTENLYAVSGDKISLWDLKTSELQAASGNDLSTSMMLTLPHKMEKEAESVTLADKPLSVVNDDYYVIVGVPTGLVFLDKSNLTTIDHLFFGKNGAVHSLTIDRRRVLYSADFAVRIWDLEGLQKSLSPVRPNPKLAKQLNGSGPGTKNNITLQVCIEHPVYRLHFQHFLLERHAIENLTFYLAADRYERLAEYYTPEALANAGNDIINRFVLHDSPDCINISGIMRSGFQEQRTNPTFYHKKTFSEPKDEVARLMELNYMHDFRRVFGNEEDEISDSESVNPGTQSNRGILGGMLRFNRRKKKQRPNSANRSGASVLSSI